MKQIIIMIVMAATINVFAGVNEITQDFIAKNEGFRSSVYVCTAGKKTIGYGFTSKQYVDKKYMSKVDADKVLAAYVVKCIDVVDGAVKVQLTDNQRAALADFVYHFGAGAFLDSTLLKKINNNQLNQVPAEFMKWNKQKKRDSKGNVIKDANGKIVYETVSGLTNRASKRCQLWNK